MICGVKKKSKNMAEGVGMNKMSFFLFFLFVFKGKKNCFICYYSSNLNLLFCGLFCGFFVEIKILWWFRKESEN